MKRLLALLLTVCTAIAQPTPPTTGQLTVNSSTGAIVAPFTSASGTFYSGNPIPSGATFANAGTLNGAGTFDFSLGSVVLADNQLAWSKISKSGSSLADLATRNAADLTGTLAAARLPAFTGDATSTAGTSALTFATVNGNVGTFGSATQSLTATVDGKGRITAISAQTVTPAWASITSKPTTLAGYAITDPIVLTSGSYSDPSWLTLSKAKVGLPLVDNTSDAAKPISTATQTALDLKAPLASPTFTGTPAAPTPASGTNTTQVATTAFTQTELARMVNGRAPQQGLVFDGTAGASVTGVPAFGTGDFTVDIVGRPENAGVVGQVLVPTTGGFSVLNDGSGTLYYYKTGGNARNPAGVVWVSGKTSHITISKASGVIRSYLNNVLFDTWTDTNDAGGGYTGTVTSVGGYLTQWWKGDLRVLIYNRALSAAEITALYESGAPASADYNSASNTSLITGDNSTLTSDTGYWSKINATFTGGAVNLTAGGYLLKSNLLTVAKRYRATINIVAISGTLNFGDLSAVGQYTAFTTTGVKTVEFTASGVGDSFAASLVSGTATVDDITLYPLGLLAAFDPQALGQGTSWQPCPGVLCGPLTWTTGVSWALPWSGVINGPVTVKGTATNYDLAIGQVAAASRAYPSLRTDNTGNLDISAGSGATGVSIGYDNNKPLTVYGPIAVNGNFTVNGTSAVKGIRTATTTHDFGTVAAGATVSYAVSVTGIAATDSAIVNIQGTVLPVGVQLDAYAALDQIYIVIRNDGAAGAVIGSRTFRVTGISF